MRSKFEKFSLVLGGALIGILFTFNLPVFADKNNPNNLPIDKLRTFAEVFGKIKSDYVDQIGDPKLLDEALKGMLSGLDPHSVYLDKDKYKDLSQGTAGEFGGLGIEVGMKDGFVEVITPIEDTPAYDAGLKSGDLIIKLDDTLVKGLTLNDAVKLMRGKPGTSIDIRVLREDVVDPIDIKITRAQIKTKSVKAKLIEPDYAYLRVTQFQDRTGEDLAKAIKKLRKENKHAFNGVILDMRNNPGGLLTQAVSVSAAFLDDDELVVYTEGVRNPKQEYYTTTKGGFEEGKLVVLIDEGSASASEIVAGAIQDHGRGIIMGSQSDLPVMQGAADLLKELGIPYEITVVSAHRTPVRMLEYAQQAADRGIQVIIAGAGGAAHLPGMVASATPLPVIGVPVKSSNSIDGWDSVLSILQMPKGVPVATVALNGGANAGILAAQILGASDLAVRARIAAYKESLRLAVEDMAKSVENQ